MATAKKTPAATPSAVVNDLPTSAAVAKPVKMAIKPAAKSATKSAAARPVVKPATNAQPESGLEPATPDSAVGKAAKKPKLVRDSFTIPKLEYLVLDELKARAAKLDSPAKKSEVLRAGVKALAAMSDVGFLSALKAVPAVKTGRPNKLIPE